MAGSSESAKATTNAWLLKNDDRFLLNDMNDLALNVETGTCFLAANPAAKCLLPTFKNDLEGLRYNAADPSLVGGQDVAFCAALLCTMLRTLFTFILPAPGGALIHGGHVIRKPNCRARRTEYGRFACCRGRKTTRV